MLPSLRLNLNTLHFSIHFASIKSSGCLAPCLAGHVSTSPWNRKLHDKGSKNLYMRNWIIYERRRSRHRHNHFFKPSVTGNYTQTLRSCVGFHFRCLGLAVARHKRQQPSKPFPPGPTCFLACQIRQHLRRKALQNALCGTSHLETRIQLAAQDLEKVTARDTSKAFRKVDCYFQILPWWCHFCDYLWAISFSLLQMEDSPSFPQSTWSILSKALFPASRDSRCSCWGLSFRRVWSAASRTGQSSSCKASTMRGTCGKQRMLAF